MLCTSNTTLAVGDIGIRSPLARVRVLLSSNTELRFSIQMASTGPSRTIHVCSPVVEKLPMHLEIIYILHCVWQLLTFKEGESLRFKQK